MSPVLHNLASGRSCHDTGTLNWSHIDYAGVSDYTIQLDSILKKFLPATDNVIVGAGVCHDTGTLRWSHTG